MPIDPPIRYEVSGAAFSFFTKEDARANSVKRITKAASFDEMGMPVVGGVHDPAMGPIDKAATCKTCGLVYELCPGHMGHIDLAEPIYSPIVFKHLIALLKCTCWHCHCLRIPSYIVKQTNKQTNSHSTNIFLTSKHFPLIILLLSLFFMFTHFTALLH